MPKSLILRARSHLCYRTRKTYRAVFSEPELVIPEGYSTPQPPLPKDTTQSVTQSSASSIVGQKKRPREEIDAGDSNEVQSVVGAETGQIDQGVDKKKKRKKNKT
ncbi:hypothetical protein BT96DRAFT_981558 [Gymnopus androsaceus JB14]|uniref:Uncharacterized protein n=1 Tax=Gymnopus androsaceus JB14 TaxID=1447944 RepID=A0A6A4GMK3_9AGAR|nr:hypothetical protein BT96DRAFT_981558 [Gymnopus androsaceus JB14]